MHKRLRIKQGHTCVASQEEIPWTVFNTKIEAKENSTKITFEIFYNSRKIIDTLQYLNLLKLVLKTIQTLTLLIY